MTRPATPVALDLAVDVVLKVVRVALVDVVVDFVATVVDDADATDDDDPGTVDDESPPPAALIVVDEPAAFTRVALPLEPHPAVADIATAVPSSTVARTTRENLDERTITGHTRADVGQDADVAGSLRDAPPRSRSR